MLRSFLPLFAIAGATLAKNVTYNFNVTWTEANPDGMFMRKVMGINNIWPPPTIEVEVGDRLIIDVFNGLGDQATSLHFHGLYQNGTSYMDGPPGVTQCGIQPGNSLRYDFVVDQPGTYWYHSHTRAQYPDGLRAPFIVTDPNSPYKGKYDKEIVLSLSDWYHDQMTTLMAEFLTLTNPTGAEPVPNSALMNNTQNLTMSVEPNKTYMIRMVNMGAFAAQYVWFEGHTMRVVEVDGIYTEEAEAEMLYITAAQRVSVLITTKNDTSANFPFVGSMDEDLFDTVPDGLNPNVTGWLVYDDSKVMPDAQFVDEFNPFDDYALVPTDGEEILENPTYKFSLAVMMNNLIDGANYAFFNDITYTSPKVPSLYTAINAGNLSSDPTIYGVDTNPFVFAHNDIVELVINNNDPGKHPFHLHGHNFQLVYRSDEDAGNYNESAVSADSLPKVPMRRDTVLVRPNGNLVLRFRADNPVWLFHCHIEWHVASGLTATFIEAPDQIQKNMTIPQDHLDLCTKQGQPTTGNAAANTKNYLDLTGQNLSKAPIPAGFTARGIVALVFSVLSAFLGMAVIVLYGSQEMKKGKAPRLSN